MARSPEAMERAMAMWPVPERPRESWDPFMGGLFRRIRRERRRRFLVRVSAAACLMMALWAGFGLGPGRELAPLAADVPTTDAPLFQPDGASGGREPIVLVCAH